MKHSKQNTEDLISSLSEDLEPTKSKRCPKKLFLFWLISIIGYILALIVFIGIRPDISITITNKFFLVEVILLSITSIFSAAMAVCFSYPDCYQQHKNRLVPIILFIIFNVYLFWQLLFPADFYIKAQDSGMHTLECAQDIAIFSIIPIVFMLYVIKLGATTQSLYATLYASIASVCVSYLVLRFIEANENIYHIIIWHYIPMVLVIFAGIIIGKKLLRW